MLERYFPKNSYYYFDENGDLIIIKGEKQKNWSKAVYVSTEEFKKALKSHDISFENGNKVRKPIANSFLKYLREVEMSKEEPGGRFVTILEDDLLIKEADRYCTLRWGGIILKIESENLNIAETASETSIP